MYDSVFHDSSSLPFLLSSPFSFLPLLSLFFWPPSLPHPSRCPFFPLLLSCPSPSLSPVLPLLSSPLLPSLLLRWLEMVPYRFTIPEHPCPFLHTPPHISTVSFGRAENTENSPLWYLNEGNYTRILFYWLNREESSPHFAQCLTSLVLVWGICLEIWKCSAVQPFFKVDDTLFLAVSGGLCCNTFSCRNSNSPVASSIMALHAEAVTISLDRGVELSCLVNKTEAGNVLGDI